MAEQRQKTHSILLRLESKNISLELFPATEWLEKCSNENLFRVRINDVWHCPTGKYSFLTYSAIGELVSYLLGGDVQEEAMPYLPLKSDVRIYIEDALSSFTGSIQVPPYQKRDGRWYVQAWIFGKGSTEVCCDDVELIRVRA